MLAYGVPGDLIDEYVRMSESTCLASLYRFFKVVVAVFGPEYLREPNEADTSRLLGINKERGFPGMLGSIDCMHCVTPQNQAMYSNHTRKVHDRDQGLTVGYRHNSTN